MKARLCRGCRKRPARFRVRGGRVKADRDHDLCFQCHRGERNRQRARAHHAADRDIHDR